MQIEEGRSELRKPGLFLSVTNLTLIDICLAMSCCSLICKSDSERLERYHIVYGNYPELDHTDTRLETTGLEDISVRLKTKCLNYTYRVKENDNHTLYQLSSTGRVSGRSGRHIPEKLRIALRSKSLFHHCCYNLSFGSVTFFCK